MQKLAILAISTIVDVGVDGIGGGGGEVVVVVMMMMLVVVIEHGEARVRGTQRRRFRVRLSCGVVQ